MKSDNVNGFAGSTAARDNRCVCCGEIIPEGLQVCPMCYGAGKGQKEQEGQEHV